MRSTAGVVATPGAGTSALRRLSQGAMGAGQAMLGDEGETLLPERVSLDAIPLRATSLRVRVRFCLFPSMIDWLYAFATCLQPAPLGHCAGVAQGALA